MTSHRNKYLEMLKTDFGQKALPKEPPKMTKIISVSFVSSPSEPSQDFHVYNNQSGWDEEDWQAAFEERAAILEFDQGMPREEAEPLACRQIEAERKRLMQ